MKLAVFVTVCAVFTAYLAFTIGNVDPFRRTYALSATFADVTGLLPNDNVKVAGVAVGKVTDIRVVEGRARVELTVREGVRIPTDTEAAVRWRNLLGQRYVYLYPGEASTVLRDGDNIARTRSIVDLGELFNRLGPIVKAINPQQVNAFLQSVSGALDGNEAKLSQAITDLSHLAATLGERDAAISRLIGNLDEVAGAITSRDAQIRTVLDNLVLIASTFSESTGVLDRAITELRTVSEHLGPLLEGNRAEIDRILDNVAVLVDVVRSKLPTIESAVSNLDEASLRLFNAGRYGEWLNQVIPCGRVGRPVVRETTCDPETKGSSVGAPPAAPSGTGGVPGPAAVLAVLEGARR